MTLGLMQRYIYLFEQIPYPFFFCGITAVWGELYSISGGRTVNRQASGSGPNRTPQGYSEHFTIEVEIF